MAQHQLHQLLLLPDEVALQLTSELIEVTAPFIDDALKQQIIDGLSDRTWLSTIVREKKWERDALPGLRKLMGGLKPLNGWTLSILRKSNTIEAQNRLMEELRRFPSEYGAYETCESLTKHPHLRSHLRALADQLWSTAILHSESSRTWPIALISASQGNAAALDYLLRIAALTYNPQSDYVSPAHSTLASLLGLSDSINGPPDKHLKLFRNHTAQDFIYLPEESRWKKKQP